MNGKPSRPPLTMILASASPRRRELLEMIGLPVEVRAVNIDEQTLAGESGTQAVLRLARAKAMRASELFPGRVILAADTSVLIDDAILGKPESRKDAQRMLELLSGRWHEVVSGLGLIDSDGVFSEALSSTKVRFADLSAKEISTYLASDEPYDKAGAYAIQGAAGWFVTEIRGSVTNVIGLPFEQLRALCLRAGLPLPSLGALPRS